MAACRMSDARRALAVHSGSRTSGRFCTSLRGTDSRLHLVDSPLRRRIGTCCISGCGMARPGSLRHLHARSATRTRPPIPPTHPATRPHPPPAHSPPRHPPRPRPTPPPACERWLPSLARDSVAAFVQAAARLTPAPATFPLRLVAERAPASLRNANPAACDLWMPGPALAATCGISASATGPVYALSQAPTGAPPRIPVPEFAADLSSLPALEDLLEPPAMCLQWMPAPAADPLFSHLQTSVAQAVIVPVVLKPPPLALPLAATHVPCIPQSHNRPRPHPVPAAYAPIPSAPPPPLTPPPPPL